MIGVIAASVILIFSTAGLLYFAVKKAPMLLAYPAREEGNLPKEILKKIADKVQDLKVLHQVASPDMLLQNVLSKTRIVALKTESKTGKILENLRKRSQGKSGNSKFSDDYWKKLRKKRV
ncbi:hypothetical protein IH982_00120 [Patescibacteria group bacterium]|nr:hypothetical protein [Patescibacteria group bacterium]